MGKIIDINYFEMPEILFEYNQALEGVRREYTHILNDCQEYYGFDASEDIGKLRHFILNRLEREKVLSESSPDNQVIIELRELLNRRGYMVDTFELLIEKTIEELEKYYELSRLLSELHF